MDLSEAVPWSPEFTMKMIHPDLSALVRCRVFAMFLFVHCLDLFTGLSRNRLWKKVEELQPQPLGERDPREEVKKLGFALRFLAATDQHSYSPEMMPENCPENCAILQMALVVIPLNWS